ncbi:rpmG, partial [Symbiodinium sp. KB8]
DVPEVTVAGQAEGSDFEELLLPLVGPELWRLEVPNARRARAWVRGWVEFNYCRGANQNGAAMKKVGLKTPVEVRQSSLGSCIKFMPPGSRQPGAGFDGLLEGGLEILVDDATTTRPARMRVRRCAYGWRKKPRESSERAILSRLRKDWELSEKLRS